MVRASIVLTLVVAAFVASGCAAAGCAARARCRRHRRQARVHRKRRSTEPTPPGSAGPTGSDLTTVPTACIGLGADDCRRVVAQVATIMPPGSAVTYIQVGPFGCAAGAGCAPSLAERPQGDVTLEAGVGALSYHVTVSSGSELTIERQDAFGVLLGPRVAAAGHGRGAAVRAGPLRPVERDRPRAAAGGIPSAPWTAIIRTRSTRRTAP